jgi:plastocyanin
MRSLPWCVTPGLVCLGLFALTPAGGQAHPYGGAVSYYPAPTPYYYAAPVVTYYPAPRPAYCYPATPAYSPAPPRVMVTSSFSAAPPAPPRPAAVAQVGAYDDYFGPRTITVAPGTTVRWTNYGRHVHTVTSRAGGFDSGDIPPGGSYMTTLRRPGVYPYYCRHHTREGMTGTVVVSAGAGGSSGSSGY